MRRHPVLAASVLLLLVAPCLIATPAHAEIGVGDTAPDFEGKDYFNCESVSLRALRGRVVLFELFSTG